MVGVSSSRAVEKQRMWRRSKVFFLQVDVGIRGATVTGVQTCALPIYGDAAARGQAGAGGLLAVHPGHAAHHRSEERRVGKQCSSRWSPYHERKKKKFYCSSVYVRRAESARCKHTNASRRTARRLQLPTSPRRALC